MIHGRPEAVEPYVRGAAWPATADATYPRADLTDPRLPADTRAAAGVPVGVRLELVADATAIDIAYETATDDLGYRGAGAGTTFSVWRGGELVDERIAALGSGSVLLALGSGDDRAIVYLPEGMKPRIAAVTGVGGRIEPAPPQSRWIAYGDSIVEGWVASGPAFGWPAIAGRDHGLDVVNMGYAGAARGEIATAEHIAALDAHVVSLAWGTNCWSMAPHSAATMGATTIAFLSTVRAGHPDTPIVVVSPVVRPDAEETSNALGATLADLRAAMEEAVHEVDDDLVTLVPGRGIFGPEMLADGIHPGTEGHHVLARVVGDAVAEACCDAR